MSDNILRATVGNITYVFSFRGEDQEVLCLRDVNSDGPWHDAFAYIHIITDGSCRHDDQLYNIMMELVQEDGDMA